MKNTDFRIGNYVMDEVSGELMVISELGESIVATVVNRDKYPLPDGWQMAPIPITEEWLERLGFVLGDGTVEVWVNKSGFSICRTSAGYLKYCILQFDSISVIGEASIDYVHQLMNLYYSLTGEELTVKEKV